MTENEYFEITNPSFEQLKEFIDTQLQLDTTQLDQEQARSPKVFSAMYRLLRSEAKRLRDIMKIFNEIQMTRRRYYSGKATAQEYKAEPLNVSVMKNEIDAYLDIDSKIIAAREYVADQDLRMKFVEDAIRLAKGRTYDIKNAIAWKQLTQS